MSPATQFDALFNVGSVLLEDFLEAIRDRQRQSPQSWDRGSAPDVLSRAFRLVSYLGSLDMTDHACQS